MKKFFLLFYISFSLLSGAQEKNLFDHHQDIGNVLHNGTFSFDSKSKTYRLSGSGANIWGTTDEFQYAYKKMRGDFILQARMNFVGEGHEAHRKTGWMIRSALTPDAQMVSATLHGDGLTSLQYRKSAASNVAEIKSKIVKPDVIQLERRGKRFIMSVAHSGEPFTVAEMNEVEMGDEVFVGLFICAHNKDVVESAVFDNVRIVVPARENFIAYREYIGSHIEILDIDNGRRAIVYTDSASLQAPNWTRNGKTLLYNSKGLIYVFDLKKRRPKLLPTGNVKNNNNDHVISFDGRMLGLSASSADRKFNSVVYTVPLKGGTPKQITPTGPSYLHGWSPDGKYLLFTGQRNNEFDIYRIPVSGGMEERLTTSQGLDDGPEYSPDGRYIYFNSVRSGTMQIWRMKSDGSEQEQLTSDEFNNWFPHISPNGKWIVFLSFSKDVKPEDHPFYKHVYLRLLPAAGGQPKVIAYLYGGQGTINTPSWSPDSRKIAFVSNSGIIE